MFTDNVGSVEAMESQLSTLLGGRQGALDNLTALLCTALLTDFEKEEKEVEVMEEFLGMRPAPREEEEDSAVIRSGFFSLG